MLELLNNFIRTRLTVKSRDYNNCTVNLIFIFITEYADLLM